jgi:hypothetical protein
MLANSNGRILSIHTWVKRALGRCFRRTSRLHLKTNDYPARTHRGTIIVTQLARGISDANLPLNDTPARFLSNCAPHALFGSRAAAHRAIWAFELTIGSSPAVIPSCSIVCCFG